MTLQPDAAAMATTEAAHDRAARALLAALAHAPRPAGSDAEARARERCAAELAALGFTVREEPFEYSSAPGRWGTPVAGLASIALLAAAAALGARGAGGSALLVLAAGALALGGIGVLTARRLVLDLPLARRRGVNLVAVRGAPAVWLMAHLDAKSQPVPIGLRALGVMATLAAWVAALAVGIAQVAGAPVAGAWVWVALAGLVGGLPVVLTTVGRRSAGALDNASGVAAVLDAARRLPRDAPVGVVLTSAEELGLAGARAWARGRPAGVALNCDGVDDVGSLVAMYTGRRAGRVVDALAEAGRAAGALVGARRLVPGILTDGVALADAGWEVATLSRGTRATLARIHSPRDDLAHLAGDGLTVAGRVLAATATALLPYGERAPHRPPAG